MQKPRYILKIEALEFPERIRKGDEREKKMTGFWLEQQGQGWRVGSRTGGRTRLTLDHVGGGVK